MKKSKCMACHKKKAYKFKKNINKIEYYECKFCGSGYMPKYYAKANYNK